MLQVPAVLDGKAVRNQVCIEQCSVIPSCSQFLVVCRVSSPCARARILTIYSVRASLLALISAARK